MRARINKDRPRRLGVIGKVKIGEKTEAGHPRSLDYFRPDGNYIEEFRKALGTRPTKMTIIFPSDNLDEVCFERLEINKGSKLWAWGDGETFELWNPQAEAYETATVNEYPGLMDGVEKVCNQGAKTPVKWRPVLYLRFFIVEVKDVFGIWQFKVGGEKSAIDPMISTVDQVMDMAGRLAGIPFYLTVEMHKSNKPGTSHKYPVPKLVPTMGQTAIDKVRELVDSGVEMKGLLTGERIEKEVKQLEANND